MFSTVAFLSPLSSVDMEVLRHPNRAVRFCFLGLLLLGALSLFSYVFSINSPRELQRFWGDFEITQNYWAVWTNRTMGIQICYY